ncbi:hypothetical protein JCM10212_007155 [Sporobolomyces blumeae]
MPPVDPPRPFHVHLTGFGPFGSHKVNPSWEAVRRLDRTSLDEPPPDLSTHNLDPTTPSDRRDRPIRLTASLLPVEYDVVLSQVPALHSDTPPPDLVVHVGVGLDGQVALERRARKWGYAKIDVDGHLAPVDETTGRRGFTGREYSTFQEELETQINIDEVVSNARRKGLRYVAVSDDAGLYLCEFTFYASLASALVSNSGRPTPVQFIHVPSIGKPYSLDELTAALKIVVWSIVNESGLGQ